LGLRADFPIGAGGRVLACTPPTHVDELLANAYSENA
jgi:hypothetical protein